MKLEDIKTISLKSVKVHDDMSEETLCFSASLYINGEKTGIVENTGKGGCNSYSQLNWKQVDILHEWAKKELNENFIEAFDLYIYNLIEKWEEEKQFKRWCKKETLFRIKGDQDGQWRTVNIPYGKGVLEFINGKYGKELEEILNERFLPPLINP